MSDAPPKDHAYLTVRELAELLRLKERKVYDLAASGQVPCSRATGKLLFPAADIRDWIDAAKSGGKVSSHSARALPPIMLGSHDPLLDWAVRQSRCGLATFFDGSLDGLKRFAQGEGVAAGLHLHDAETDSWNVPAVSSTVSQVNAVLVAFGVRRRGLVFRKGDPVPAGLGDLCGRRMVPRQPASGTATLFHELLAREELDKTDFTFTDLARTETEAVEMVSRGDADIAFGLEAVATTYGLAFSPVVDEQFALLVDRRAWFEAPFQRFLDFCGSDPFHRRAASYGGYDVGCFGEILWNA